MEKFKPHSNLATVKAMVGAGKIRITFSALSGAAALVLDLEEVIEIVMSLNSRDFYESMTTHSDHRVWQDVYPPSTAVGDIYLKRTVNENVVIISFKEL